MTYYHITNISKEITTRTQRKDDTSILTTRTRRTTMATESAEGETTVVEGLYMAEEEEGDLT